MQRFALRVQYAGEAYLGWQRQPNQLTVQGELEKALSFVADHPVAVVCAGRTDQGVHALGQIAHFDTEALRREQAWVLGTNTQLPPDIRVCWSKSVSLDFHARFSAQSRTYVYKIWNHHVLPPFWHQRALLCFYPLDIMRMQEAADFLIGEKDFSSFRGADCQSITPMRCVYSIQVKRDPSSPLIELILEANAFLHHMVRNIVGLLIEIGRGRYKPVHAKCVLEARDRKFAPAMVAPDGLYLQKVNYGDRLKVGADD